MANASTVGFGLRAVMTVGNTPATSGQSEYLVQTAPGVGLYKGDPHQSKTLQELKDMHKMHLLHLLMMVEQVELHMTIPVMHF
jgi:hypothetical protein